eukprot:14542-Pyramimonas_sp.AAC.1
MEGGSCSKCGSRASNAYTRLKHWKQLHGWRAVLFRNVDLASAPHIFVLRFSSSFKDSHVEHSWSDDICKMSDGQGEAITLIFVLKDQKRRSGT